MDHPELISSLQRGPSRWVRRIARDLDRTRYFQSGWAFFVPYFVAYAIFWAAKGPFGTSSFRPGFGLYDLFLCFHVAHLVLFFVFIGAAWLPRSQARRPATWWPVLVWVLLALLFLMPGAYLEYPADPWEHLWRINVWKGIKADTAISLYKGGAYFLMFSCVGRFSPTNQIVALGFLETLVALAISWQYYRLARHCGVRPKAAMLFVLLQAMVAGNNVFGFYRYYSLSSAALGHLVSLGATVTAIQIGHLLARRGWPSTRARRLQLARRFLSMGSAAALAALLHSQALLVMIWAAFAVCIWVVMTRWLRPAIAILAVVMLLHFLAAFLHVASKSGFAAGDTAGSLNTFGGFDLLGRHSPASVRALSILGAIGVVNLVAAAALLRKNRLVGLLTLVPFVVLQSPVVSGFIELTLVNTSPDTISAFLRTLFAIPPGLALVVLSRELFAKMAWPAKLASTGILVRQSSLQFSAALVTLAVLLVIPPGYPTFCRLWHALHRPSADLQMGGTVQHAERLADENADPLGKPRVLLSGSGQSVTVQAFTPLPSIFSGEQRLVRGDQLHTPNTYRLRFNLARDSMDSNTAQIYLPVPTELYSPYSISGLLSGHWYPQEVALSYIRE